MKAVDGTLDKILIVEDEADMRELMADELRANYIVFEAGSLAEADLRLKEQTVDLILLDGTLPDGNGFQYCARLRADARYRDTPVIFVTGRADLDDKAVGFAQGGDDYLTKPFALAELSMRIEARLRNRKAALQHGNRFSQGDLTIDVSHQTVSVSHEGRDIEISLTPHEFKLLYRLASEPEKAFTREQLIAEAWGQGIHVTTRTIDTHLSNMRKKLFQSAWTVRSVHGVGYHWTLREKRSAKAA